jgi:hypothetical protein
MLSSMKQNKKTSFDVQSFLRHIYSTANNNLLLLLLQFIFTLQFVPVDSKIKPLWELQLPSQIY